MITANAGASQYYKGGVTAYANQTKENILGVEKDVLLKFGAVSKEVAEQMSEGVKKALNTDYSIATTGIAGTDAMITEGIPTDKIRLITLNRGTNPFSFN